MRLFTIMSCGGVYQLLLQTCSLKLLITFRVGETYFSRTYQDVFLEYLYGSLRRKRSRANSFSTFWPRTNLSESKIFSDNVRIIL